MKDLLYWVKLGVVAWCLVVISTSSYAQSVQKPEKDNSVESEKASFELADEYEINLFADETNGIANPIAIRWDAAGRLWALCTWAYPQLKPDEIPNDKLLILEDTDGDGRADKTTVWVDGLNMPTGFALGHGGVYIGHGTELIHIRDTDGDGRGDERRVVLTGFGTGDTHQNINSFTWSPGGELMFLQGLHSFSRVETPWGIVRGDQGGIWRFRPQQMRLQAFIMNNMASVNPWGINYGRWGEMVMKSNDPQLWYTSPAMIPTYQYLNLGQVYGAIGKTFDKGMAVDIVETKHMPDKLQGQAVIAGYFAHIISTMPLKDEGAGIEKTKPQMMMRSTHRSFRPVDVRIGPRGAIYVADWFNPIIGHYQASFRHPDRDKKHGRIWRITAKGRPLVDPPALIEMSATELCEQLASEERWVRYQAKRLLADLPADEAMAAVASWVAGLAIDAPNIDHHLYEAMGVFESHEKVNQGLVVRLMQAKDPRARAYAARVIGRWHDRLNAPLSLLERSVLDTHPRVRMEAIVALAQMETPQAMVVAAKATSLPMDGFIEYSFTQCSRYLAHRWLPALGSGEIQFASIDQLIQALKTCGRTDVNRHVRKLLELNKATPSDRRLLLLLLARFSNDDDVHYVLDSAIDDAEMLSLLVDAASLRKVRPTGDVSAALRELSARDQPEERAAAVRLAGLWRRGLSVEAVRKMAFDKQETEAVRVAAFLSLADVGAKEDSAAIRQMIRDEQGVPVRLAALEASAKYEITTAVGDALWWIAQERDAELVGKILDIVMIRRGAKAAMASTIPQANLPTDAAKIVSRWMTAAGYDDASLVAALKTALGIELGKPIEYSDAFVRELAAEVRESGNAIAGRKVFNASLTNCTSCHRIGNDGEQADGFRVGPDLTSVGAGVPLEIIIESIVWPQRQIKEGYETKTLFLEDGRVMTGYIMARRQLSVTVRELPAGQIREVPRVSIEDHMVKGSAMPSGFINTLTRQELRDLARFLSEQKAGGAK